MIQKFLNILRRRTPLRDADGQLHSIRHIKLSRQDIAIDCGANVGEVTVQMARTGATVYAFEPNPYAFAVLQDRFADHSNVHCFNQSVLDKDDTAKLYLHEFDEEDHVKWSSGASLLDFKGNINVDSFVEVEVIDFARFVESLNTRIRLIKIDVEGVEYRILNRLIDTGAIHKIDYLLVESHERKIPELQKEAAETRQRIQELGLQNIDLSWI